jgi:broad specificity phosphatase PhoE
LIPTNVTLYVIRHGETHHNVERRLTGQQHSPLTPRGIEQARRNGEILRRIEPALDRFEFVASPLERALQTMELVRESAGLPRGGYRTDERVQEIDVGTWFALTMDEARGRFSDDVATYESDPWNFARGGKESFAMVHERIRDFAASLDHDTVVVSHFHPVRMFRALALGATPDETLAWQASNLGVLRVTAGAADYFAE